MRILNLIKYLPVKVFVMTVIILSLLIVKIAIPDDINFEKGPLILNGEEYLLEIARSTKQRRHGLMFRDHLDKRQGMLFIYPRPGDHRIWMKNTLIPLTVIWLDENKKVIGIKKLRPCTSNPCPSYGVSKPSKYILELNSGSHGLTPGLKIEGISSVLHKGGDTGATL